jgi:Ca-activated chloride channel family protein
MMGRIVGLAVLSALFTGQGALGGQAQLDVSLAHPSLLVGKPQTTYLKVGLTGFEVAASTKRAGVNVALVLDKSGSMSGHKLEQAKQAAISSLDRLNGEDIVSVITYDTTVQVVMPATKLTDKHAVRQAIQSIQAGGNTALFAGVSKGGAEVRKFLDRNRVNRVILLSDGLANEGPSSPHMLGDLGGSLVKEGIAVTTLGLGLGYNEDLMVQLADRSDGNHVFVEEATELAAVFSNEFRDVLSVVAQEIAIKITCAPGIRPVRLLGEEGEIRGQEVNVHLNQLYGGQEKYVLLEVEVPNSQKSAVRDVADVAVSYANMVSQHTDRLAKGIGIQFVDSQSVVDERMDKSVMTKCVLQIANERNVQAVALRDAGEIQKAQELLQGNCAYLKSNAIQLQSPELEKRSLDNLFQSQSLDEGKWRQTRKGMRERQIQDKKQQVVDDGC